MQKLIFLTLLSSCPSILREQISRCPAYNCGQVHAIVFIHAGMFPKRFFYRISWVSKHVLVLKVMTSLLTPEFNSIQFKFTRGN